MLELQLLTPEKELFDGNIVSVEVPGADGRFTLLRNHAPIIAALVKGNVLIKDEQSKEHKYEITSGFVECQKNRAVVLAEGLIEPK